MAYIDLNPIRAKIAPPPEESTHTSVQKRIESVTTDKQPKNLLRFAGMNALEGALNKYQFSECLALVF
ncbi:hypothetical protein FW757_14785 [Pseudoalteromonas sp. 1181_04]